MKKLFLLCLLTGCISIMCQNNNNIIKEISENDPTISIRLLFQTGSQDDPKGKEGLATITAQMLTDASTKQNSYDMILQKLYPMSANYEAQVDKEVTVIAGRTHKDNWTEFYKLFKQAVLEPAFEQSDFDRIKKEHLNYLENTLRYSNDEELGKQALNQFIFQGTSYDHPEQGLIERVKNLTLKDVESFYKQHYNFANLKIGLGGSFSSQMESEIYKDMKNLPEGTLNKTTIGQVQAIDGLEFLLIDKDVESTAISLGFPITLLRSDADFAAMWLANSWLGEHRNSSSHLYQVIRETRGMNYGDYSYIEAFPNGHARQFPPTNVGRHEQIFQIWIRPVQNHARLFALRAALRELDKLVKEGMSEADFELTKNFLSKYYLHFAPTTMQRLGFKLDDYFYGLDYNFLENFASMINSLTLEQVNTAIKKYLQAQNIKIVMVTQDAQSLKNDLLNNISHPMTYTTPKPESVLEEDKKIAAYPLPATADKIKIVNVSDMFVN